MYGSLYRSWSSSASQAVVWMSTQPVGPRAKQHSMLQQRLAVWKPAGPYWGRVLTPTVLMTAAPRPS